MADGTGIAWTDATWNPLRGCSHASIGCLNCYAERQAARWCGPGGPYEGLIENGRWNGKVRLVPEHLSDPIRWQRPRRVFVNSMSDLFHPQVGDPELDAIWARMLLSPRHTFQVATKRPARALVYLTAAGLYDRILHAADRVRATRPRMTEVGISNPTTHPAPWIHLLVSCSVQAEVDRDVPILLQTPVAVRGLSLEPLVEPIDVPPGIDWVIVGGESGSGARPCNVEWIRSIVRQCEAAGVSCFVKQLGAQPILRLSELTAKQFDRLGIGSTSFMNAEVLYRYFRNRAGADPSEWPEDIRVRGTVAMARTAEPVDPRVEAVTRKLQSLAGPLVNGKEWAETILAAADAAGGSK